MRGGGRRRAGRPGDGHEQQPTNGEAACVATKGTSRAKGGAVASDLGTTKRKDGALQVTYGGHPLYTFAGDKRPGDTNGQEIDNFGGEWYVVMPNGHKGEFH